MARSLAAGELRVQALQVWGPLMTAVLTVDGLPMRSGTDALWLLFVIAGFRMSGWSQFYGHRCRRVLAHLEPTTRPA